MERSAQADPPPPPPRQSIATQADPPPPPLRVSVPVQVDSPKPQPRLSVMIQVDPPPPAARSCASVQADPPPSSLRTFTSFRAYRGDPISRALDEADRNAERRKDGKAVARELSDSMTLPPPLDGHTKVEEDPSQLRAKLQELLAFSQARASRLQG